jgi:hypothetical protein
VKTVTTALFSLMIIGASTFALAQTSTADQPCVTQEQLVNKLKSLGYGDIKLSDVSPSASNPHPEISCRTPEAAAATTATHRGWNGTATKDGKQHNIYVDAVGRVTED